MTTELRIRFDGDAPGLQDHRLSIAAFGKALVQLLAALRRTASSIENDALTDEAYGAKGGRYAKSARCLDLQLNSIEDGCINTAFQVIQETFPGEQMVLFKDLETRAVQRFIEHVRSEVDGVPASAAVRKFLRELPEGLAVQRYELFVDGTSVDSIDVGTLENLAAEEEEIGDDIPVLRTVLGLVSGVSFDDEGQGIGLTLTPADMPKPKAIEIEAAASYVEKAIEFRGQKVRCQFIDFGKTTRLLTLRKADAPLTTMNEDEIARYILDNWRETLTELAK